MKENTLLALALLLVLITQVIMAYSLVKDSQRNSAFLKDLISDISSYNLWNPENAKKVSVTGVYFSGDNYYCVSTKNRDWTDIKMTDYHEMCHAFLDMDYNHFCLDKNQTERDIGKYIKRSDKLW